MVERIGEAEEWGHWWWNFKGTPWQITIFKKIHETAMSAKGLGPPKHGVTRRNLTQMMHLEDSKRS